MRSRRALTPEEHAWREARRRANAKLGFLFHLIPYAGTVLFLLLLKAVTAAFAVAFFWGIGIAFHYLTAFGARELRQRWIEREVERQLETRVSSQRRELEGAHSRSLEALSASIAHEIRNPITAAKSLVQQLGEDPGSRENVQYAQVALEELDRVERSISHLLRFARDEELRLRDVRLADVLDAALETFRDRIAKDGVAVERGLDTEGPVRGDAEQLRRVVINLVANALDAFEQARTPDPRLDVQLGENLAGTEVWLRVRDNGPGIPAESRARVFSPFFTSKSDGTGLGLALAKKVVDAHGGAIEVGPTPDGGTDFLVTLPRRGRPDGSAGDAA